MDNIPKVIHYCWFGRAEKPKLVKKCIKSWNKYLKDYKVIEWNEDNFDINSNQYVREAYEHKKYAFVSDYVRFYVLYHYGGIYMDTDVEVIKPLDKFLSNYGFTGFESKEGVAPGLIFAIHKRNEIVKEILDSYEEKQFVLSNGEYNKTTVVKYTTDILKKYGLECNNTLQNINGIIIYPKTYFCPLNYNNREKEFSEFTHTIHHFVGSWISEEEKRNSRRYKKYLKRKEFLCKFMSERFAYIILDLKWIVKNKVKFLYLKNK